MGRPIDYAKQKITTTVEAAELALSECRPTESIALLRPLQTELPPHGRKLLIEAARNAGDRQLLVGLLTPPQSIAELIDLFETVIASRQFGRARSILSQFADNLALPEPLARELRSRLDAEEAIAR
jgi:hypothetical protein